MKEAVIYVVIKGNSFICEIGSHVGRSIIKEPPHGIPARIVATDTPLPIMWMNRTHLFTHRSADATMKATAGITIPPSNTFRSIPNVVLQTVSLLVGKKWSKSPNRYHSQAL